MNEREFRTVALLCGSVARMPMAFRDAIEIIRQPVVAIGQPVKRFAAVLVVCIARLRPRFLGATTIGFGLAVDRISHSDTPESGAPP